MIMSDVIFSFDRECAGINCYKESKLKIQEKLEDSFVRNMLVKAVYLTNASLAVHSNVIERITNIS